MSSRANSTALRREIEARFTAQGLVLEQIMNRLDAMAEPAPPVPNKQNMPEPIAANPSSSPYHTCRWPGSTRCCTLRRACLWTIQTPEAASVWRFTESSWSWGLDQKTSTHFWLYATRGSWTSRLRYPPARERRIMLVGNYRTMWRDREYFLGTVQDTF